MYHEWRLIHSLGGRGEGIRLDDRRLRSNRPGISQAAVLADGDTLESGR